MAKRDCHSPLSKESKRSATMRCCSRPCASRSARERKRPCGRCWRGAASKRRWCASNSRKASSASLSD
eukprot:9459669-Karenia_brevis.AAC.1